MSLLRRASAVAAGIAAVSLGGCGLLISYTDYTAGAGGSGTATGSSTTASATGGGGRGGEAATGSASATSGETASSTGQGGGLGCSLPDLCFAPPADWSGPVLYDTGKGCPSGWQFQETSTAFDLACACQCPSASTFCSATVDFFTDSNCTTSLSPVTNPAGCTSLAQPTQALSVQWSDVPVGIPGCTPAAKSVPSKPTVSLCGPSASAPCASGACAPPPGAGGYCVTHAADVPCPAGFAVKHVIGPAGTADKRTCDATACACGPSVGSCNGELDLWPVNPSCAGAPAQALTNGGCTSIIGGLVSGFQVSSKGVFNCTPSGASSPMGEVAGPGVQTVCCSQ